MAESFKIRAGTFEEFWALLLAIPIQHRPVAAEALRVAWHSARAAERKTPTQNCSRCDVDKPRASFPDSEWNKRPELKRYCTDCKRAPRHRIPTDPKAVWRKVIQDGFVVFDALAASVRAERHSECLKRETMRSLASKLGRAPTAREMKEAGLRANYEEDSQVKAQTKGVKRFFLPHS